MKRLLTLFLIAIIYFSIGTQIHADTYTYPFPFTGRWQPTEDPALLDNFGLQDIQNVRKWGKHFRGILGDQPINTDEISGDSTYYKPRSGYHFKKDNPSENHILIQAFNADETESKVYQNITSPPNTGDFSTTSLHTDDTDALTGRFSIAPQGNVVYCNQKESLIWGGNERQTHGFLVESTSASGVSIIANHWDRVYKNDSDKYYTFTSGATTFYIGSTRRFDKAKIYIKTANTSAATLTVAYYTGWSWVNVSGLSDGTSSGGISLATTGTVSWTHTDSSRTTFIHDDDNLLYWYRFSVTGINSTTAIYYITIGESSFRAIENIWDGTVVNTAAVWAKVASGVSDLADVMNQDPPSQDYAEPLVMTSGTHYLLLGAAEKLRGFDFRFADTGINTGSAGVTIQYYNGNTFTGVTGLVDKTALGNASFNHNGRIHWLPNEEWDATKVEATTTGYSTEAQWYFYKLYFSGNIAGVSPYYIRGIPAQGSKGDKKSIGNYRFGLMFQRRLFLFCEENDGNKIIYSASDAPDVFNGSDSGTLYVGDSSDITAAGVLFNTFVTAGYEQLVITKGHSTYRLYGDGPSNWILEQISDNIGCAAPMSFVVAESTDTTAGAKRNVALWQASHGYVAFDGATIETISYDIACYWDRSDSRGIALHRLDDTFAWYDPDIYSLKVLLSSGAETNDAWGGSDVWDSGEKWGIAWEESVTTHNTELEYSLRYKEWTKIYRENTKSIARPLQVGFQVKDSDNKLYPYGAADDGMLYRLEYTNTFDKKPITMYLQTADIMPGTGQETQPFFNHSTIEYIRLLYKNKAFTSGETVVVTHKCDNIASVTGTSGFMVPDDILMSKGTFNTQDCFLGPCLRHSFKFTAITSSQDYGMELLGLGLWYTPIDTILDVED